MFLHRSVDVSIIPYLTETPRTNQQVSFALDIARGNNVRTLEIFCLSPESPVLPSSPLCDRTGRRGALILSSALFLLGGALMGWSPRVEMLIVGRLVSGVATGLVSTAVPQYLAECALPSSKHK